MLPTESLPDFVRNPDPEIYLSDNFAVLDLETTSLDKGDARNKDNRLVCGVVYNHTHRSYYSTFSAGDLLGAIADAAATTDFIVAQGSKFELKWLVRCGIDISRIVIYDTLLGDYVLSGNRGWRLDLDSVAKRHGAPLKDNVVSRLIKQGVDPTDIPKSWLIKYCKQDVTTTLLSMLHQRQQLHELGLLPLFYTRCFSTPVIADMEMRGMKLDRTMVEQLRSAALAEYADIVQKLHHISGGINMASPQQVATFMYKVLKLPIPLDYKKRELRGKPNKSFPEGQPSTDDAAIGYLLTKAKTAEQKQFLTLKSRESKLRKQITSYLDRFERVCAEPDAVLYGNINQSIADTHRLTSSDPNLQNIDRSLKKVVTSRHKDAKVMTADYAQLEFRVAGELADDKQALKDIINKHDVHSFTASVLAELPYDEVFNNRKTTMAELRQQAKADTFKPLYGGTSGTKAQQKYYAAFRERYPEINSLQQKWLEEALSTQRLRMITGLIMYYPGTEYNSDGSYVANTSKIFNHPVQQFATADLAPTGVALLWHYMKAAKLRSFLINEVHDSAIGEVFDDEQEIVKTLARGCMTQEIGVYFQKVFNYTLKFPYEIDIEFCSNWGYNKDE